jgi:hypothetical protein
VIDGYTDEQIAYHAYLMVDAGLVRKRCSAHGQQRAGGSTYEPHMGGSRVC